MGYGPGERGSALTADGRLRTRPRSQPRSFNPTPHRGHLFIRINLHRSNIQRLTFGPRIELSRPYIAGSIPPPQRRKPRELNMPVDITVVGAFVVPPNRDFRSLFPRKIPPEVAVSGGVARRVPAVRVGDRLSDSCCFQRDISRSPEPVSPPYSPRAKGPPYTR